MEVTAQIRVIEWSQNLASVRILFDLILASFSQLDECSRAHFCNCTHARIQIFFYLPDQISPMYW